VDANLWPLNSERGFWERLRADADESYVWGNAGPTTVKTASAVVPVSTELLDDVLAFDFAGSLFEMMRQDAIYHRSMRRLKVADPAGYDRLKALLRLGEAARLDREDREREARRCPTCGCDPEEHNDRDW
jgi:hypothetical protein